MNRTRALARTLTLAILCIGAGIAAAEAPSIPVSPKTKKPVFSDVRAQAKVLMGYASSIYLSPEQQKIKEEVLSSIPTTCCKKFSMLTCCCPCNMAMTIWGLSNYMLAHHAADARQLRAAVDEWVRTIGPKGFTGDACDTGGCARPFAKNGCGGMDKDNLVF